MRILQALVLVLCGSHALGATPAFASPDAEDAALTTSLNAGTEDQPTPDYAPRTAFTVRLQPPFLGLAPGGFTLMAVSFAARFAGLVETELGANSTATPCDSGSSWFARAGISPSVLTAKADGTHWNLRIPLLVSYVDYSGRDSGCDDIFSHDYSGYQVSTGLDATYWGSGSVGFNLRLLGGTGGGYRKTTGPYTPTRTEWISTDSLIPEITLSIGIALK
jgi:hypothetical protein